MVVDAVLEGLQQRQRRAMMTTAQRLQKDVTE
jgi:hypothetical protein